MGIAQRKAELISKALGQEASRRDWVLEKKATAKAAEPLLWDAFAEAILKEVPDFSGIVAAAKTMTALLSNGNTTICVQTTVCPLVKLTVNRTELGIMSKQFILKHSLGNSQETGFVLYRFSTDRDLEPCFSDADGSELSPQMLAERLLEPIFDAFDPS